MPFFPEKTCQVGGNGIQQFHQFLTGRVIFNYTKIFVETVAPDLPHSFSQAGAHQFLFAIMKIDAAVIVDQSTEAPEVVIGNILNEHGVIRFQFTRYGECAAALTPDLTSG